MVKRHLPSEAALVGVLALWLIPQVFSMRLVDDEFITLNNALRILAGEVMYRDFFEFTAPLSHYAAALTFAVTGPSLVTARAVQAIALLVSAWQLHRLARLLGVGPWLAMLPGLTLVLALFRIWPVYSHHWFALPFFLGAMLLAMRGLMDRRARWWAAAGAASGLTLLSIQSDGAVILIAIAGLLLLHGLMGGMRWREAGIGLGSLLAGWLGAVALGHGYFLAHGALDDILNHTWLWALNHYKVAGGINDFQFAADLPAVVQPVTQLPFWYGRLFHFVFLFTVLPATAVVGLLWGASALWRRTTQGGGWSREEARFALVAIAAVGSMALATRGRADYIHVAFYAVVPVLMATALAARLWAARGTPEWRLVRGLPLAALGLFCLTGAYIGARELMLDPQALRLSSPDQRFKETPVIRYLQERSQPEDRIVALPYGGFFYFYSRPSASRYTLMVPPGIGFDYNTEAEYRAVWDEITTERPRFVVFSPWRDGETELEGFLRYPLPGYRRAAALP
ncbi:MAG: glycosyltransferase family 39 protein, partial [Candidatus Sericytochromatia bacterium]